MRQPDQARRVLEARARLRGPAPTAPFKTREEWLASFDLPEDDDGDGAWLHDPTGAGPTISLLQVPEPKIAKNRLHIDIKVSRTGAPEDRRKLIIEEVSRLLAAGATIVWEDPEHHVTMADPEGNEFCVC